MLCRQDYDINVSSSAYLPILEHSSLSAATAANRNLPSWVEDGGLYNTDGASVGIVVPTGVVLPVRLLARVWSWKGGDDGEESGFRRPRPSPTPTPTITEAKRIAPSVNKRARDMLWVEE